MVEFSTSNFDIEANSFRSLDRDQFSDMIEKKSGWMAHTENVEK